MKERNISMDGNNVSSQNDKTELLHIGDVHLGNKQYSSNKRKKDYVDVFREAIQIGIEENVDAVFHTGDLFDSPNPDIEEITVCIEEFNRLKENDIPFLSIVGNHERKWTSQWMDLFSKEENAYRLGKTPVKIGKFALFGIDSLRHNEWQNPDKFNLESVSDEYTSIVCMHELLSPLVRDDIASCSVHDVLERLSFVPDILALGDSHTPSSEMVNGCYTYYPGALEKTSVSDSKNHHVVKITSDGDSFEMTKIQLTKTRPLKQFTVNVEEDMTKKQLQNVLKQNSLTSYNPENKNPLCVLCLEGNKPQTVSVTDINEMALEMGAEIVHIQDKTDTISEIETDLNMDTDAASLSKNIKEQIDEIDITRQSEQIRSLIETDDDVSDIEDQITDIVTGDTDES